MWWECPFLVFPSLGSKSSDFSVFFGLEMLATFSAAWGDSLLHGWSVDWHRQCLHWQQQLGNSWALCSWRGRMEWASPELEIVHVRWNEFKWIIPYHIAYLIYLIFFTVFFFQIPYYRSFIFRVFAYPLLYLSLLVQEAYRSFNWTLFFHSKDLLLDASGQWRWWKKILIISELDRRHSNSKQQFWLSCCSSSSGKSLWSDFIALCPWTNHSEACWLSRCSYFKVVLCLHPSFYWVENIDPKYAHLAFLRCVETWLIQTDHRILL